MQRHIALLPLLVCVLAAELPARAAQDQSTSDPGLTDPSTNATVVNGWMGPSPLPLVWFDFEDKQERGTYPYTFAVSGLGEIGKPVDSAMTSSGSYGLIVSGGGPASIEFLIPVEQIELDWIDENHLVKSSIAAFDEAGAFVFRENSSGAAWFSLHYFDINRPIARLEIETQSTVFTCVIDDLRVRHRETAQSFCLGDGQVVGCPCSNMSAAGSFEGCVNSSGRGARMHSIGNSSTATGALRFFVDGLPAQRPVLLLEGTQEGLMHPFRDGIFCLGHLRRRLGVALSDETGSTSFGAAVFQGDLAPVTGDVFDYQCWFRDPQVTVCGSGSGFSQAQRVYWN